MRRFRECLADYIRPRNRNSGRKEVALPFCEMLRNPQQLLIRLTRPVNHFRETTPGLPLVIDPRIAQIGAADLGQLLQRLFLRERTVEKSCQHARAFIFFYFHSRKESSILRFVASMIRYALQEISQPRGEYMRIAHYALMFVLLTVATAVLAKENSKGEDRLTKLAEDGNKQAQLELGISYLTGKNAIEPDAEKALQWLTAAASLDEKSKGEDKKPHPRALLYMGFCYDNPKYADFLDLKVDREKALEYYIDAHKYGYPEAPRFVAFALRKLGRHKESLEYFKAGADRGLQACQIEYAKILLTGKHIKPDPEAAIEYLEDASVKGNPDAQLVLADVYSGKYKSVPPDPSKMIDYLWQAAAKKSEAMARVGYCYEHGIGMPSDPYLAFKWYEKATQGAEPDPEAVVALAGCYARGVGTKPNERKAFELYLLASGMSDAPALAEYNVGVRYSRGIGTRPNPNQAFIFFERAAGKGFGPALNQLGERWAAGLAYDPKTDESMPPNPKKAVEWFEKAVATGDVNGMYNLGMALLKGEGIDADQHRAKALLTEAAKKGHPKAKSMMSNELGDKKKKDLPGL